MSRPARSRWAGFVVAIAVAAAVATVLLVSRGPASPSEQAGDIAAGLKCPSCQALSVAESNSTMAQSMRAQIHQQLRQGRSPDQIRTWFVQRYGPQVLLTPSAHGLSLLLWVLPGAVAAAGVVALLLLRRRAGRRRGTTSTSQAGDPAAGVPEGRAGPAPVTPMAPVRVGVAAVALVAVGTAVTLAFWGPGDDGTTAADASSGKTSTMSAQDWTAVGQSLEQQQSYDDAANAYRKALRLQPDDAALRTRLAFTLVRAGHPDQAIPLVTPLAQRPGSQRADALLVLGLAQRAQSMPAATATLREFLQVAPHHPAAGQVRRLLREAK